MLKVGSIMRQYAVYYRRGNTDCCTYVTMSSPSESQAMAILLRQGTIKSTDNVYIIRIEPR
jgi:hypothetical protein